MITIINSHNHIITGITTDNNIKTDIKGESIENLSNMLVSILKSYRDLGLSKEDLFELVEISYEIKLNS